MSKAREFWIQESYRGEKTGTRYPESISREPKSTFIHVREVLPDEIDSKKCDCGIKNQGHIGIHLSGCPHEMTEREERKLIERTCKRDAAMDALQWAGVRISKPEFIEVEHGSILWYLLQKYENHKHFCDEHSHYYDYASGEVKEKE